MKKPRGWDEFLQLVEDPARLEVLMRVRLVELLFTQDGAVSIRAAEMLSQSGLHEIDVDLSGMTYEELLDARDRAAKWLNAEYGSDDGGASESGISEA